MKIINSVQKWVPFDKFLDGGIIKLKNNSFIKLIKIIPINFNLKSDLEKEAILNSYKIFLKTFNSNIQILIQSSKENLSKHISQIKEKNINQKNKNILNLSNNYIQYIENLNQVKKSSSKNFYILLKKFPENKNKEINETIEKNIINNLNEEYFILKECLMRCGNRVIEIETKEEIKKIIKTFFVGEGDRNILIKENLTYKKGTFSEKDKISPSYINLKNPKYIEIDNRYYSGIIIVNYYREYHELILKKLIDTNINMNISIFYEKQDTYKTLRDLTYNIGNVGANIKENNSGRQDTEIAAFTYNDAKYIRKEMQINNEELYFLYIYITIYASDVSELNYYINKIEGILESMGLQTKKANFRQEEVLLACMPTGENNFIIKNAARRNVLTSGLISTYPFITSSIFDEQGIFIGTNIYNDSLIFIDRYNSEKYKNANMCVFGTSGSRKIFLFQIINIKIFYFRNGTICN